MASVRGRVLLGWLSRDQAVQFLLQECVFDPPLDAAAAETLWRPYRNRAIALPERAPATLTRLRQTPAEIAHAKAFMGFLNGMGSHDILEVIKVDLSGLAVIQHHVVTERCDDYAKRVMSESGWLTECLPTAANNSSIRITPVRQAHPFSTGTDIDIPHAEFLFAANKMTGAWTVSELLRHVTAVEFGGRTFLKGGYHRSFARISATPTATVPSAVVALASNASVVLPVPTQPAVSAALTATADLSPFGRRAAVLRSEER